MSLVERLWYRSAGWHWVWYWSLCLLAFLYSVVVACRRAAYRHAWLPVTHLPVPVVVVGNLTVGGSGKTPFTLWLVDRLRRRGFSPGIVSRGYGGRSSEWPRRVSADSDPREVGDEPVLLARRLGCPVVVGPDRVAAARKLLEQNAVDVIVADDGLQHYALGREIEIAIVDGDRRFGNGRLLPAGPLREPLPRLGQADLVVVNGGTASGEEIQMSLAPGEVRQLAGDGRRQLKDFIGTSPHALAGIGNPPRFFASLKSLGIDSVDHPFPDHYIFRPEDIVYKDNNVVLMTEKDAVKCRDIADSRHWYVTVDASLDVVGCARIDELIERLRKVN